MNLTGKHLLICEEALTDYNGHFFTWIKAIRTIHLAAGARVTVAANRSVIPEIQREIGAIPTYTHNIWKNIYYHPNPLFRYAGVFLHNWRVYTQTARLLKQIGPVDLILLPACRIHHLIAWRLLCARYLGKKFQRLLFFILTSEAIYNSDFTTFHFKKSSLLLKAILRTFAGLTRCGAVVPAGDSHITCHEYETFSGLPFRVLPSPGAALTYAHLSAGAEMSTPSTHDAGPRFVMLGLSGYDKGTDLVQDAVLDYLEKNPGSPARFVIQWSKPVVNPDGTTIPIRAALRNAPQVQLIEGALSDAEYQAEFTKADFLLLPYRRRIYFNRISGVAVEAACSGIPMIVTENTWLSWALEELGAGVTVENDSAADLVRKITHCAENWNALAHQAKDLKHVALEKNSTDRYLMCAWEQAPQLTSQSFTTEATHEACNVGNPKGQVGRTKQLRILLRGWYGQCNLGDDLLLLKILAAIPAIHHVSIVGKQEGLLKVVPEGRNVEFLSSSKKSILFAKTFAHANMLIVGGGGLFPYLHSSASCYLDLILASLLHKKLLILGVGINPHKRGIEKLYWSFLVKRATYLSVRDGQSAGFLYNCVHGSREIPMHHDLYLSGAISGRETQCLVDFHKPVALICPAGFSWETSDNLPKQRYDKLICEFTDAVRTLDKHGFAPVLVSIFPKEDNDFIRNIIKQPGLDQVKTLEYMRDFQADEAGALFKGASFCLCMRFHSLVLATQNFRNFVAISYDYKSLSLLKSVDMESAGVPYGIGKDICFGNELDLAPGRLSAMVEEALPKQKDVERHLAQRMPILERDAQTNLSTLDEIIRSMSGGN